MNKVTTNESYVSVLNHCFDDIEKFIIRLQQAVAAIRELQAKKKSLKRSSQDGSSNKLTGNPSLVTNNNGTSSNHQSLSSAELAMLNARACGPNEDDYFEILSKFKLAFNLLAKLKGCIHEPNAPELVHFLFTPLAIIIESARNAMPPIDPTQVGVPYLNQDALDLLSNCCTSKESDMWISLGPNWTQTIDMSLLKASRLPSSFQPIFSDGWAPVIGELELIGLTPPPKSNQDSFAHTANAKGDSNNVGGGSKDIYQKGEQARSIRQHQQQQYNDHHELSPQQKQTEHQSPYSQHERLDKNSREHQHSNSRQKRGTQQPFRHSVPVNLTPADPYHRPYPVPYGYTELPNMEPPTVGVPGHSVDYRVPIVDRAPQIRNSRHNGQVERVSKHYGVSSSSRVRSSDYHINPDLAPPYPLITGSGGLSNNNHPQLSVDESHFDLLNLTNQSDDYTELHHEQYPIDDPRHSRIINSSHYRGGPILEKSHKQHNMRHNNPSYNQQLPTYETEYFNESEHEAMLLDLGPSQTEWFYELQSRGALIVRVLFTREANNDKELSVTRGEILEILDDSRKWWRARNVDLQVAHIPHTIVAVMEGYQTLDELLANNPESEILNEDSNMINPIGYPRSENINKQWHRRVEDKRNSKTAGAFRYF